MYDSFPGVKTTVWKGSLQPVITLNEQKDKGNH